MANKKEQLLQIDNQATDKTISILKEISKPRYWMASMGITQRMIKSWDEEGLIDFNRETQDKRRAFSIADFCWLQCISEFRSMGTPVPLIKSLKDKIFFMYDVEKVSALFKEHWELLDDYSEEAKKKVERFLQKDSLDKYKEGYSFFLVSLVNIILKKEPAFIILFQDGTSAFWLKSLEKAILSSELSNKMETKPYTSVPVLRIVNKMLLNEDIATGLKGLGLFDDQELYLLEQIRIGNFVSLKVTFKNKKLSGVAVNSMTVDKDNPEVLEIFVKHLTNGYYKEMALLLENGKSLKIENT